MRKVTIKLDFSPYCFTLSGQILMHSIINNFHFDSAFIAKLGYHFEAIKGKPVLEKKIVEMISHHLRQENKFIVFNFEIER